MIVEGVSQAIAASTGMKKDGILPLAGADVIKTTVPFEGHNQDLDHHAWDDGTMGRCYCRAMTQPGSTVPHSAEALRPGPGKGEVGPRWCGMRSA